jgi:type II secretory pathway component PulF
MERAAATTMNPYIERDLLQAIPYLQRGMTLDEALAPLRCLSPTAREMLHVGEQSGKLEQQLRKAADYHMEEANYSLQILTRVFGVAIVLAVALLIGYIVISFYTTYYGGIFNELGI